MNYTKQINNFSVGGMKSVHLIIIVATGAVLVILLVAVGVVKKG